MEESKAAVSMATLLSTFAARNIVASPEVFAKVIPLHMLLPAPDSHARKARSYPDTWSECSRSLESPRLQTHILTHHRSFPATSHSSKHIQSRNNITMANNQPSFEYDSNPSMDFGYGGAGHDDGSEDGFLDAYEHQHTSEGFAQITTDQLATETSVGDDYAATRQMAEDGTMPGVEQTAPRTGVYDGSYESRPLKRTRYNPADDHEEHAKVEKENNRASYIDAYHNAIRKSAHVPGCSGQEVVVDTPGATPPVTPAREPSTTFHEQAWQGPNEHKDLSRTYTKYREFQAKAKALKPNHSLATHRYWIGVLHPGVSPKNPYKEDQFMWLKGNRLTTVETVMEAFGTQYIKQDFVLMLGAERLEKEVMMEECDLMNDKVVILRYMDEEDVQAKGREISGTLVTKEIPIVEID